MEFFINSISPNPNALFTFFWRNGTNFAPFHVHIWGKMTKFCSIKSDLLCVFSLQICPHFSHPKIQNLTFFGVQPPTFGYIREIYRVLVIISNLRSYIRLINNLKELFKWFFDNMIISFEVQEHCFKSAYCLKSA